MKHQLEIYDSLIGRCSGFERKGKSMFYTSANRYLFSILNMVGEISIRFSKKRQTAFMEEHQTTFFKSYGAVIKDFVLIPTG